MYPNAQLKASELTTMTAASAGWNRIGALANPRIAVPITSGTSGAEYWDVNENCGS